MTHDEKLDAELKKMALYLQRGCKCKNCGKHISYDKCQLAHRIPKSKANLQKYGKEIIHHELNLELACSLRCNDRMNIGNRPEQEKILVSKIKEALC